MKEITMKIKQRHGFTIVELLIVIVVIGILAAISIVAYNGIQDRARLAKMQTDVQNLSKAIQIARNQTGQVMGVITGNFGTAGGCESKPNGTDLAALPTATDSCWTAYANTLNIISTVSGVNVRNLVDPYGRPYFIDENENEASPANCNKDTLGAFPQPFVNGWGRMAGTAVNVPNSAPGC